MLSSVTSSMGITISTSQWNGVEVLLVSVHQFSTGPSPDIRFNMCGHISFFYIGVCPNCEEPDRRRFAGENRVCYPDDDDSPETVLRKGNDDCLQNEDFSKEIDKRGLKVKELPAACLKCQEEEERRLEVAEALEGGDDVDSSDISLGAIGADPEKYAREELGFDVEEA